MAEDQKDTGREGDMGTRKPDVGKQGGMPEKKEWEKERGGVGTSHEPGRTPEDPPR